MTNLKEIRYRIDALDEELLELLGKRYEIVRQAGKIKAEKGLELVQHKRIEEVLDRTSNLAEKHDLDSEFIREVYRLFIAQAHKIEEEIIGDRRERADDREQDSE